MTYLSYIGVGVVCSIPLIYLFTRIAGLAWFRSRADYDRGFINRKGRD